MPVAKWDVILDIFPVNYNDPQLQNVFGTDLLSPKMHLKLLEVKNVFSEKVVVKKAEKARKRAERAAVLAARAERVAERKQKKAEKEAETLRKTAEGETLKLLQEQKNRR